MMGRSLILMAGVLLVLAGNLSAQLLDGPESVAFDTLSNCYMVSNIGDGNIIAVSPDGEQSVFASGFGACFGNCIKDDILYLSNNSRIFGLDLVTKDTVLEVYVSVSGNADGLTTDSSGYLYVVDTDGAILKIDLATQTYTNFVSSGLYPSQDIVFDPLHNRLLVAGYTANAPIQAVSLEDSTVSNLVFSSYGYFDGITFDKNGFTYLSSHVGHVIIRYDSLYTEPPTVISTGHAQPSGLDYNFRDNMLAIPNYSGDRLDLVHAYIGFDADSIIGWAPFEVEFTGIIKNTEMNSWSWDYGDGGSGVGQISAHTYGESGIYDVTLTTTADGETYTYSKKSYIVVLADTLRASEVSGDPEQTVMVEISFNNILPLKEIRLPIEFGGTLNIDLDSFSTVGCRAAHFDNVYNPTLDNIAKQAYFVFSIDAGGDTSYLEAGEGTFLKLYFSISSLASFGQTTSVELSGFGTRLPLFIGEVIYFQPGDVPGQVSLWGLCGDANGDAMVNILDISHLIAYLYQGGQSPENLATTDVNSDTMVNILDISYLIAYLYQGGPAPGC